MATFIAVSGPSTSGKTSLVESLSTYKEMSRVKFSPDFHTVVWNHLKSENVFSDFTDITDDGYYMCTYLHKLADTYNDFIESYEEYEGVVFLDSCWIDLAIYANLNMWYDRMIKSAQDDVFNKILKHSDKLSRIYFTKVNDYKYPVDKYRIRGRITTFKMNRPLEIKLYDIAHHLRESVVLTQSDTSGDSIAVIEDLKKMNYI